MFGSFDGQRRLVAQVRPQLIDRTLPTSTKSEGPFIHTGRPEPLQLARCPRASLFFLRHSRLCDPSHTCSEAQPDKIYLPSAGPNHGQSVCGWRRDRRILRGLS
jgi:hypothetical protein